MIAVATYIQQKCKQKPITRECSSVIWQKITQNGNALNGVDPMVFRKILLKIACKLAINIEMVFAS